MKDIRTNIVYSEKKTIAELEEFSRKDAKADSAAKALSGWGFNRVVVGITEIKALVVARSVRVRWLQ